ncbi:MAG: F0F1 ATP synthase subunit B' [Alphaproteobacteria bacterium]
MNPISKTGVLLSTTAAIFSVATVALGADDGQGGGSAMPQLDFSTYGSQMFWLVVSFAVLFLLMWKVAIPRVGEVIEAREQKIRADLERAEQLQAEIADAEESVNAALAQARAEAQDLLRKAQDKISADHAKKQDKLDAELAERIAEAEQRIDAARKEALASVREVAEEVAAASVEKLTGQAADAAAVKAAVDGVAKEG